MAKTLILIRHTDNDGDVLTEEGVAAAMEIGIDADELEDDFRVAVSTGAQRATQTMACMFAVAAPIVDDGVIVEPGLRSDHEDRWREAYEQAGSGELADLQRVASDFVEEEARMLGAALRRVLDRIDDGERALVVGHSPTNEAAVYGLTGERIAAMGKGEIVTVRVNGDGARVRSG